MNVVAHNMMATNAYAQYGINNKSYRKSTEKLSTGYQINRAADDAAGLSISEKMRHQVRNLNQAMKNVEDGASLIKVADGAMQELHNMVGRQREILVKAANEIYEEEDYQAIQDEIREIEGSIEEVFQKTSFNERKIFRGKDTILSGPDVENDTDSSTEGPVVSRELMTSKVVWVEKGTTPTDTVQPAGKREKVYTSVDYREYEALNDPNDGHPIYDEVEEYNRYKTTETTVLETETKYTKLPTDNDYTKLVKPGTMVGQSGYINVKNVAGDLSLSCAMSQLGVKVDGKVLTYDLYGSVYPKSTTVSDGGNRADTTFDLRNGIKLTQTISLIGGNQYNISYNIEDTSGTPHDVDVRLAFDVLNTPVVGDKGAGSKSYSLETDMVSLGISASNAKSSAIGNINDMYGAWDDGKITAGVNAGSHAGVGYWWSENTASGSVSLGSVSYGPLTLKKEPYQQDRYSLEEYTKEIEVNKTKTVTTILPEYLNIQSGANAGERTVLRLYDLSVDKLKYRVGQEISAFSAPNSLEQCDRVAKKLSAIRSEYGAMQNRLEYIYNNNGNYSENLSNAESLIRDTDMASEVAELSKHNILMQASQAMLSQANSNNQYILSLLQ